MTPNCLLFSKRESPKSSRETGGAVVLGELSLPERPTNLDKKQGKGLLRLP